jgi:hypothetical protein
MPDEANSIKSLTDPNSAPEFMIERDSIGDAEKRPEMPAAALKRL